MKEVREKKISKKRRREALFKCKKKKEELHRKERGKEKGWIGMKTRKPLNRWPETGTRAAGMQDNGTEIRKGQKGSLRRKGRMKKNRNWKPRKEKNQRGSLAAVAKIGFIAAGLGR